MDQSLHMNVLFSEAVRVGASDLHIVAGYAPVFRQAGTLIPISGIAPLTSSQTQELLLPMLTAQQKELVLTNREIDFSIQTPVGRFRANLYFEKGSLSGAFRFVPANVAAIDALGLPQICHDFSKLKQGFILVTGPTGHGKSTTLAAIIQEINQAQSLHIITIEDPIEFIYPTGKSIISQREMHGDTHSWGVALRSALREDPDVVLIGEMRDLETIEAALTIAETGHLVFATLHTNSAAQTIDRIVGVFPEAQQAQIRLQLAGALEAVVSQRLLPQVSGGRIPVTEILLGTPAVRATIREGRTHLIDNIIQTSVDSGMMTFEMALAGFVKAGRISQDIAMSYALRPEELTRLLKMT